jgi:thioredoxin reductase (NADPH)
MVETVRLKRDGKAEEIAAAGIFAYVGLDPNAGFAPSGVGRDERGFLIANDACETRVAGIWAVGAVRAGYSGLLRDAAVEAQRVADAVRDRLD